MDHGQQIGAGTDKLTGVIEVDAADGHQRQIELGAGLAQQFDAGGRARRAWSAN